MPVLTAGEIYLQVKAIFGSKKVKKYGVLYGKSPDSHPYLDLFDSSEDYQKSKHGKKCEYKQVDLHHIKKISNETINGSKGVEFHIEIQTKKEKVVLMVDSDLESQEWSSKFNSLCSDKHEENSTSSALSTHNDDYDNDDNDDDDECVTVNQMYGGTGEVSRFEVEVEPSEFTQLCDIVGKRSVMVTPTCIIFENSSTRQVDCTFQIAWLRRFGKKSSVFSFEVGRSCPNGPGHVKVKTTNAKAIHDMVRDRSNSRGTTVIPPESKGIATAKNNVQHVIEKKIENSDMIKNNIISGPATIHLPGRRHPALKDAGPKLIPLQNRETDSDSPSPVLNSESKNRQSSKSICGDNNNGEKSGSVKQGQVSDHFTKKLENQIAEKESVKLKEKERDSRRKEIERKKEEKENRKREEKKEKERKDREKKEQKQKEKAKKDEKKGKEKVQQPPARVPGAYEEVDIIDQTPSPKEDPKTRPKMSHYEEPDNQNDETYSEADQLHPAEPAEYAQPMKKPSHVPCEYSDVKTVKGNAWQSYGRGEDEEQHMEDYSEIKSVRKELGNGAPPLPDRGYEEEDDDDTYNRISLKTSKNCKQGTETHNIYGTASGTKVRPIKGGVQIPEPDYDESDSGESLQDDTYDNPDFDTYDSPVDQVQPKKPVESYEEAKPQARVSPQRVKEESLYDEVS